MKNKTLLLGFTATPNRTDKKDLGYLFQDIVYQKTIHQMLSHDPPYLAKPIGMLVKTEIDISDVKTSMGDFQVNELSACLDTPARNKLIVDSYLKLCPGDKAIVFCINKAHTKNVTEYFNNAGIKASYIDADTPADERKKILKDFSKGKIKILCNCAVLTEGFDESSIQAVILARATQSEGLYIQMLGRGLRPHPDKQFCKIIDIVDNTGNHKLKTVGYVLDKDIKSIDLSTVKEKKSVNDLWSDADNYDSQVKELKAKLQTTSLFGTGRQFSWLGSDNYRFIEFGGNDPRDKIEIVCTDDDKNLFQILVNGTQYLKDPMPFDWCFGIAEEYLNENLGYSEKVLLDTGSTWRDAQITDKQIKVLSWQLKIMQSDLMFIRKGEAAEAINNLFSKTLNKDQIKNALIQLINDRRRLSLMSA